MRKLFGMLILLTMMMSTGSLHAEEPIRLDPVTVEAQQEISPERNIETIDLGTEAKPVTSTIPDALDKTSGLDIQRRSILTPKNSQVRIRGLDRPVQRASRIASDRIWCGWQLPGIWRHGRHLHKGELFSQSNQRRYR